MSYSKGDYLCKFGTEANRGFRNITIAMMDVAAYIRPSCFLAKARRGELPHAGVRMRTGRPPPTFNYIRDTPEKKVA